MKLAAAVALSLAAHCLLFAALATVPTESPGARAPEAPLPVDIAWSAAGGGPGESPPPEPVGSPPPRARPSRHRVTREPPVVVTAAPAPAATALPAALPSEGEASVGGDAAAPERPTGGAGPRGVGAGGAGPGGSGAGSAGGAGPAVDLGALIARLEASARACYPAQARRFRMAGQAEIRFCVQPDGTASGLALEASSGSALLDRAAVDCVVPGAEPLPIGSGCYRLPVRFGAPVP